MTSSVTWKITAMERNSSDGGVTFATWQLQAKDDVDTVATCIKSGSSTFVPDASKKTFIDFSNLKEDDVLGWVWNQKNTDEKNIIDKAALETEAKTKVDNQVLRNKGKVSGMPW